MLLGAMLALVLLAIVPALAEDTPSGPDAPGKGKADPGKAAPDIPAPDIPVGEPPPAESAGPISVPEVPATPVGEAPAEALKTPPVPLEQAAPVVEAPAEAPVEDSKPPPAPVGEDTPPVVEAPSKAPEAPPVQPKPDIPEDPEDPPIPVGADTPAKDVSSKDSSSKDSGGFRPSAIPEIPGSGSLGERLKALSDCELLELLGFGCGPDADDGGAHRGDRADDEDERTPGRRGSLKNEVGQEAESGDVK